MFNNKKKVAQTDLADLLTAIGVKGANPDMSIAELTQLGSEYQMSLETEHGQPIVAAPVVVEAPNADASIVKAEVAPEAAVAPEATIEAEVEAVAPEVPVEAVIAATEENGPSLIERVASLEAFARSQEQLIKTQANTISQLVQQGNQFNTNFSALGKYVGSLRNEPSTAIAEAAEAVSIEAAAVVPVGNTNKVGASKTVSVKGSFLTGQGRRTA